jgi:hypothetical protein
LFAFLVQFWRAGLKRRLSPVSESSRHGYPDGQSGPGPVNTRSAAGDFACFHPHLQHRSIYEKTYRVHFGSCNTGFSRLRLFAGFRVQDRVRFLGYSPSDFQHRPCCAYDYSLCDRRHNPICNYAPGCDCNDYSIADRFLAEHFSASYSCTKSSNADPSASDAAQRNPTRASQPSDSSDREGRCHSFVLVAVVIESTTAKSVASLLRRQRGVRP